MTKLKKELIARGIVYDNDGGYEEGRSLIAITDKYIITLWGCLVLPSEIHLFDRNFNFIGSQDLIPHEKLLGPGRTWNSIVY